MIHDLINDIKLEMEFKDNNATWKLMSVSVEARLATYVNSTESQNIEAPLDTQYGQSFLCTKGFTIELDAASLELARVHIQPFKVPHDTFANPMICAQDINTVIPAVVGAILALLVILVLITYVIGRRRTRIAYQ